MAEPRVARKDTGEPTALLSGTSETSRTETSRTGSIPIFVNGEARDIPHACTVAGLLAMLEIGRRRVAVAVNGDVVPKSSHADTTLSGGDRVEILEAVGGG